MNPPRTMPVQGGDESGRRQGRVCEAVYMRAYEVYCHVWAPQPAMVEGECRGGFGKGELVALLYAGNFPRAEWRARFDEAIEGMDI